jgi:hypothetical protein
MNDTGGWTSAVRDGQSHKDGLTTSDHVMLIILDQCMKTYYYWKLNSNSNVCSGQDKGTCITNNHCRCFDGYAGFNCYKTK